MGAIKMTMTVMEKIQTWSLTILFERCSTKFSIWLKSLNLETELLTTRREMGSSIMVGQIIT